MSGRPRQFLVEDTLFEAPDATWQRLPADLHRHLAVVLRLGAGDEIELRTGSGQRRPGTLALGEDDQLGIVLGPVAVIAADDERPVALLPALIKPARFEWMLEKATELGVDVIRPVLFQRTVSKWKPERQNNKLERWERIVREAARQSGARLPQVHVPVRLAQHLSALAGWRLLVATPGATATLGDLEVDPLEPLAIVTGPEGGLTPAETDVLRAEGALEISLGTRILRAETAPVAILAALRLL